MVARLASPSNPALWRGIDRRCLDEFGSRAHEHAKLPAGAEHPQQCARGPTVQQSVQFARTVSKADDQFMQCVQCHVRIRAMRQFAEQFPLGEFEIPAEHTSPSSSFARPRFSNPA